VKSSKESQKILNRFTTIPFLMDLLKRKQLSLLNPNNWEDRNDKVTMELFREKKHKKSIYALCLTHDRETNHHWNAFANGMSGCLIEFYYDKLIDTIPKKDAVYGKIEYIKLRDLDTVGDDIEKIPFLKRDPFRPEKEFRIVILSDDPQRESFDIPISLDVIRRIVITNKLPESVFESIQQSIIAISPEFKGEIIRSTLYDNAKWKNHFMSRYTNNRTGMVVFG